METPTPGRLMRMLSAVPPCIFRALNTLRAASWSGLVPFGSKPREKLPLNRVILVIGRHRLGSSILIETADCTTADEKTTRRKRNALNWLARAHEVAGRGAYDRIRTAMALRNSWNQRQMSVRRDSLGTTVGARLGDCKIDRQTALRGGVMILLGRTSGMISRLSPRASDDGLCYLLASDGSPLGD
jgi:hypothetical protein